MDETARPSPLVGGGGFVFGERLGKRMGGVKQAQIRLGDAVSADSPAEDGQAADRGGSGGDADGGR